MSSHGPELFSLEGKLALVTGNGLIPHAIVTLFRNAGAQVVHAAEPALDEEAVETVFSPLRELDILVNGSIRTGAWPIDRLELDEWDRVHATNVRGAFLMMREAARVMCGHGRGGRLITISTIGSVHPVLNGNYAYGSSRAGTNALVRQFALDFAASSITSNAILVGAIRSDPFPPDCPMPPTGPGMDPRRLPLGYGTPEDVAPLALLLASEGGRYITGQSIAVDGGFLVA
ncbi:MULTISPECIES: SDR family NAD(P)-dependent oxidoreductase [Bacteria]|uniref:SDR family NAD(P)-dependent oxidoreductase n=1 Tax=Bacteria TaxID=2 RepID=UPI001A9C74CA|nr:MULTISPECIES: SDR family oxidoreductase [Bacteria]